MTIEHQRRTAIQRPPLETEIQLTPQDFVGLLFNGAQAFFEEEREAAVVARFGSQVIRQWDFVSNYEGYDDTGRPRKREPFRIPMHLTEGVVLRSENRVYGVALGQRRIRPNDYPDYPPRYFLEIGSSKSDLYPDPIVSSSFRWIVNRREVWGNQINFFTDPFYPNISMLDWGSRGQNEVWRVGQPLQESLESSIDALRKLY